MNGDKIEGAAHETVGKLKEGAGDVLGDRQMQGAGLVDQAAGAIQHGYGQVRDGAKTLADGAPAIDDLVKSAKDLGRRIDGSIQERFGTSAPIYALAGAIAMLGVAVFWAGRERD